MARVTIEDCMEVVENRFALSIIAIKRAKRIVAKKVESLEMERKFAEAAAGSEGDGEIPSAEVVERNMDKASRIQEEHKPVLTALKEIAEKKLEFSNPDAAKN